VIAGRIVSGIGAAGMTVIVSVLITGKPQYSLFLRSHLLTELDLVPLIQVAAWRSYVNVVATLGRSIGGPLGGLLADTVGWRWSFTGQAPIVLIAIFLVAIYLPSSAAPGLQKGEPSKLRRIDFIGAFLLATTIISLLGALSFGGQTLPWRHPIVTGLLIGCVVVGIIFVMYETKYAMEPIFPPTLVTKRDVATSYAVLALQIAAQLGVRHLVSSPFSKLDADADR
jgi:MFS family permease